MVDTHFREITSFSPMIGGVEAYIKLTPKSGKNEIKEFKRYADGFVYVRVSVTSPPENNKANKALIKLLKKVWKPDGVEILSGEKSRQKKVLLKGDCYDILENISNWMKQNNKYMPVAPEE